MIVQKCIVLLAVSLFISACASTQYFPPEQGDTVKVEFNADFIDTQNAGGAQVLAFKDPVSCDQHPQGVFVGLLCPNVGPGFACKGMKIAEKFAAGVPITLKVEYKFGGIHTAHGGCSNQFTFTPRSGTKYRALIRVTQDVCNLLVQNKDVSENWVKDKTVIYNKNKCIWW